MDEEKKEEVSEDTEEKTSEPEEKTEEKEETKEDFVKEEVVPAGKYNQSIRKLREMELENRELKKLADTKPEKEEAEDEKEDIFKEEKLPDINHLIDEKVKPVLERLNKKEADDRKNQRDTFFTKHPEYLDAKRWNELLDEVDNSLNPNSKDNHYTQLEKAHRILSAEQGYSEIDKKKKELAADSASKGDGSNKPEGKKSTDEREDRLGRQMPKGYEFKN